MIFTYFCVIRFIVDIRIHTVANIKDSLAQAFQLLPKALAVNCLGLIIVIMGLFFFLIPGFILASYFVFINQILVIEKTKVIDTFKWSFLITNKNWVKLFIIVFIYNVVAWGTGSLTKITDIYNPLEVAVKINLYHILYYFLAPLYILYFEIFMTLLYLQIENNRL